VDGFVRCDGVCNRGGSPLTAPSIGTIVAKNYLPFARVLARSLRRYHPNARLVVALADELDESFEPEVEPFSILTPAELGIPNLGDLAFRAMRLEFAVALKPYLLAKLLESADSAVFLDPDMLVLGRLDSLFDRVRRHAVTLVPHFLEPPRTPHRVERELVIHRCGAFNAGVLGVAAGGPARAFLSWWQDRVHSLCVLDVERGLHYDQRWLDLVPGFVEDLHLCRDTGINVAHWNLPERPIHVENGTVTAGGVPCKLFHFSGFDPDDPEKATRYRPELRVDELGQAERLFRDYAKELDAAGWEEARLLRYAYERFNNGVRIPEIARRLYADHPETCGFGNPFDATGRRSYFHWLKHSPVRLHGLRSPNRLWLYVHRQRPDLQGAFPHPEGADRRGFLAWIRTHGMREHGVPPELA
jgi:hypothetical protein